MEYTAPTPTKVQIACNAIRDMFFNKHYKGIVPIKDLETVKNGKMWHIAYTKKAVHQAIKELDQEGYINLDEAGENWLWGGAMHDSLFPKNL